MDTNQKNLWNVPYLSETVLLKQPWNSDKIASKRVQNEIFVLFRCTQLILWILFYIPTTCWMECLEIFIFLNEKLTQSFTTDIAFIVFVQIFLCVRTIAKWSLAASYEWPKSLDCYFFVFWVGGWLLKWPPGTQRTFFQTHIDYWIRN